MDVRVRELHDEQVGGLVRRTHTVRKNKGKKATVLGLEFGEKVLWKHGGGTAKMEKINARWNHGMFVGVKVQSNELIIIDQDTK